MGAVRLKGTGAQCFRIGYAGHHPVEDGIRLIPIGHYGCISKTANWLVEDEGRILYFGGVVGLGSYAVSFRYKNSIATIFASPHDEIGDDGVLPIRGNA